jgi:hypothetical protein
MAARQTKVTKYLNEKRFSYKSSILNVNMSAKKVKVSHIHLKL